MGIIRNHYVGRTFILPTQGAREMGVRMKLSPNRSVLAGKRVTASFKLKDVEDKAPRGQLLRLAATLNVESSDKPALVGEVLALVIG